MRITIRAGRQRELMGVALKLYDALAKGTQANLTSLNLPTMAVDTARAQNEAWKEKLAPRTNRHSSSTDAGAPSASSSGSPATCSTAPTKARLGWRWRWNGSWPNPSMARSRLWSASRW